MYAILTLVGSVDIIVEFLTKEHLFDIRDKDIGITQFNFKTQCVGRIGSFLNEEYN